MQPPPLLGGDTLLAVRLALRAADAPNLIALIDGLRRDPAQTNLDELPGMFAVDMSKEDAEKVADVLAVIELDRAYPREFRGKAVVDLASDWRSCAARL